MRGQLPSIMLGDLNMTIPESPKLALMLRNRTWCDTRMHATKAMIHEPTCHVGPSTGSIIDHIFVSPSLYDLVSNFQVQKSTVFKDHSVVSIQLAVPSAVQTRMSLRKPAKLDFLKLPSSDDELFTCQPSEQFTKEVQSNNVNEAYKIFLKQMNSVLQQIATLQGAEYSENDLYRGRVRFHDQRRHPRAIQAHASTLQTRKLFKAFNQASEVAKAQPGFRRDKTWQSLSTALQYVPDQYRDEITDLLKQPASHDAAKLIADKLQKSMEHIFRIDNNQRLNKWKQRMRSCPKQSFTWLRQRAKSQTVAFPSNTTHSSVNTHVRLDTICAIWKQIYEQHKNGEPSFHSFMQKYGETIKRDLCSLNPLTGQDICELLKNTRPSSPGLDSIAPYDLKILAHWCPALFDMLAEILNLIERTGKWPTDLPKGSVTFIPKTNDECPNATDYRPLTILSAVYRTWAAIRHNHLCKNWLPRWKATQAYGLKQAKAADALAFDVCMQVSTDTQNGLLTSGISYDMKKCFDSIPINLVIQVFNQRGADVGVIQALAGLYNTHTKFFQLEGTFTHAFKPCNGIVQGCPLSMILLTSLVTTWIEYCDSRIPEVVPRSYADDLSLCASAMTKPVLVQKTREMHQLTADFVNDSGMTLNSDKCFTFGDKSVAGCLRNIKTHKSQFRLVGGSIKIDDKNCWSELEKTSRSLEVTTWKYPDASHKLAIQTCHHR